jgi:PAS domain-containing protein
MLWQYGGALVFTLLAVFVRLAFDPLLGNTQPLVTLFATVTATAWLCGCRPAIVVAAIGYLTCAYLFIEPRGTFGLSEARNVAGLGVYALTCSIIIGFGEAGRFFERRNLQTLLDTLPIVVFIAHDPDCRTITGNRAAYELLRVQPRENLSLSAPREELPTNFRVFQNGTELRPDVLPVQRAAKGERVWREELELVFDDGRMVRETVNAIPLLDARGQACGAVAVLFDVTREKRALEAFHAIEERLRLFIEKTSARIRAGQGC